LRREATERVQRSHARKLSGQQAAIGVAVLNRMIDAVRSDSVRTA